MVSGEMFPFQFEILLLFVFVGATAGFLAGLLGIGGGIILVPLFLWAFPLSGVNSEIISHLAFGTSLAVIFPTALSSAFGHRRHGNVNGGEVGFLAVGGVAGSFAGAYFAASLSGDLLKALFGIMQIMVALKFLLSRSPSLSEEIPPFSPRSLICVGTIGGVFSAFFGVGGGIVAVPLMVLILKYPIHRAVGNSSALIVVSSFAASISYAWHGWNNPFLHSYTLGYIDLVVLLLVAPSSIVFANVGSRVAGRVAHDKLVRVFAFVLIMVGIRMLIGYLD